MPLELFDPEVDQGPFLYKNHSLVGVFVPPHNTRVRHRYRGMRESDKINLHGDQTYMMIGRLYQTWRDWKRDYRSLLDWLKDGVDFASLENEDSELVSLEGTDALFSRVQALQDRVKVLECLNG